DGCVDCFSPQPCTASHWNQAHRSPKARTSSRDLREFAQANEMRGGRVSQPPREKRKSLSLRGRPGLRRRSRVLLAELVDAAAGIHNFLLARIERMAVGAHFDL